MGITFKLYYYDDDDSKVYVKTCVTQDYTSAIDESLAWCRENCEERGVMDFYYNGHKIWMEI